MQGKLIIECDGDELLKEQDVTLDAKKRLNITMKGNGGFVLVFE